MPNRLQAKRAVVNDIACNAGSPSARGTLTCRRAELAEAQTKAAVSGMMAVCPRCG